MSLLSGMPMAFWLRAGSDAAGPLSRREPKRPGLSAVRFSVSGAFPRRTRPPLAELFDDFEMRNALAPQDCHDTTAIQVAAK